MWVLHCNCLIPDNSTVCVCQLNNIGYDDAIPLCLWGNAPANCCPVCSFLPHYLHYRWGRRSCTWSERTKLQVRQSNNIWAVAVTVLTCCESSCTSSNWFTQAPWIASLNSDVVLSKGVKSRDDHFTICVSHTSLVCG